MLTKSLVTSTALSLGDIVAPDDPFADTAAELSELDRDDRLKPPRGVAPTSREIPPSRSDHTSNTHHPIWDRMSTTVH